MSLVAVFDTNILISSGSSLGGAPFRCLALARTGEIESVTCIVTAADFLQLASESQ